MLKLLNNNYILDNDCINLLMQHLKEHIAQYYKDKDLYKKGYDIYLHNDHFRIKYHKHIYNVTIVKINNLFHYYLQHYKEHYTILITTPQTFNIIINKIKEIDKRLYKDKK